MKKRLLVVALIAALVLTWGLNAQKPARNINPQKHANLAAAQDFLRQAYEKIIDAQKANEWDLAGHAEKAKALIDQANAELKLAAETSNKHKGK